MEREKSKRFSPSFYVKTSLKKVINETSALTWKNYLIFSRSKLVSGLLIIGPFLVCLYLYQIQNTVDGITSRLENPRPNELSIQEIPKCIGESCVTLGIGLTGGHTELSNYIIDHISRKSKLKKNKDVKVITEQNPASFVEYVRSHQNKTSIGMILCTNYLELPRNDYLQNIHCDETKGFLYLLLYNFTFVSLNQFDTSLPDPIDSKVLAAKIAIDNAILSFECKKRGMKDIVIEAVVQSYPLPPNRFLKGYDASSTSGPLYFFIPPMFVFGLLISEIVKEKELRLRNGLSVIGVSATSFWLSWFLVALFFSFMTTIVMIFSGYLFGFTIFLNTPFVILFVTFMTYTLTMMILGFFLSTLITSVRLAYTVSFSFLLCGLVLQSFLKSQTLMRLFYIEDLPYWVPWVRYIFSYYPPFSFARVLCNIVLKSGSLPSHHSVMWELGPGYSYSDFIQPRSGHFGSYQYFVPADYLAILDLFKCFLVFSVLTWYFDHIIPENRGRASPYYFMFTKEYWGCRKKPDHPAEIELSQITKSMRFPINTYSTEYSEGIKLDNIWKKYSGSKIAAVKPLSFIIEKDECLAIIGHNGAGKTTLLSMITGLLMPSGGTAMICNYDIRYELEKVQSIIGYCPQFNILWEEMTAREHLQLFAKLRNTPLSLREKLIEDKLSQVGLSHAGDKLTKTFSGGMKRRLSVIISSIGNPSVIFMDEPTTGMDPLTRREVWKLIQDLKKDRVIVLTTHSMEEAELLSDRVAVMVDGFIKCSGSCLSLKNSFGEGYKVEIIDDQPEELWNKIEKEIKGVRFGDISGNSLFLSIPKTDFDQAKQFFEVVERMEIKEWGLRNSSLEEVFMRVTGKLDSLFEIN